MEVTITPANDLMSSDFIHPASRRAWLKGVGALLGTGLLAAPAAVLAAPAPAADAMALAGGDEFIGMVKLLTGATVPAGWLRCDGRELPIADYPALFALLGTTYGGNGRHTFALPDMRADMAEFAARAIAQVPGATPLGQLCVVKATNAPALTTAVAELRLVHLRPARRPATT
jgi:hypothetical protein